jgi:hypothetical protein
MFIWKDTQKRANPYSYFTDAQGTQYPKVPRELLEEIPDPIPPEDFSDDLYYRNEMDDAPYVTWTRKPQEQIDALVKSRILDKIAGLEQEALRIGLVRTLIEDLLMRFKVAAAQSGITEAMLLDPTSPAFSAAYKKAHDNDAARAELRKQIK